MEAIPLRFDSDKEIIVLTQQNIETAAEAFIFKSIGNYSFFKDENNLIITNVFNDPYDRCTLLCKQFYSNQTMREKVLAATFTFFDKKLLMANYVEGINNATRFPYVEQQNTTQQTISTPMSLLSTASHHFAKNVR